MRVWLVDFDGEMENLALMRLSSFHKRQGDSVALKRGASAPELWDVPDKVYVSCIFRWNGQRTLEYAETWNGIVECGGTGVDIAKRLSDEVAECLPDYSLYNQERAVGFISRGCIRRCPWCVVPEKEGLLRRVSTAETIVSGHPTALFLDNNFLALPDHERDLRWLAENRVSIDFNQGLDARLVIKGNARLLAECRWGTRVRRPRLALDTSSQRRSLENALQLLEDAGVSRNLVCVFVLIGFSGVEDDVDRLLFAHSLGARVFPMGFRDLETGEEPAKGWDRNVYRKYRRLLLRLPHAKSVWEDFKQATGGTHRTCYKAKLREPKGE